MTEQLNYSYIPVVFQPGQSISAPIDVHGFNLFALAIPSPWQVAGTFAKTGPLVTSGSALIGATSVVLTATTLTGTAVPGDTFTLGGHTYTVNALSTAAANSITVQFTPGLAAPDAGASAVVYTQVATVSSIAFQSSVAAINDQVVNAGLPLPVPATNFVEVTDDTGAEVKITGVVPNVIMALKGLKDGLSPLRYLQLVSGTNGSQVALVLGATLYLIAKRTA